MTSGSSSADISPFAARLAGRGIHYAWVVAATTFLTMLVTAGAVGAPGVLIGPLEAEFGWATADISFYASLGATRAADERPRPLYLREADAKPQASFVLPRIRS